MTTHANWAIEHDISVERLDQAVKTRTRMVVPTHGIPQPFRRLLGPTLEITDDRVYEAAPADRPRGGSFSVRTSAGRAGVQVAGLFTLASDTGGCRFSADGELNVKIPLLKAQAAKLLSGLAMDALEDQTKVMGRWLRARRVPSGST